MKILCLHGMGTNADILKAQTASFRSLLPSHFTFDFLEGEHDCPAADNIAGVYPEPYVCWYPLPPYMANVADAHDMIRDVIEEDGPFDGVMGFSQGAALAASILLHHELSSPLEPAPFRFAIFICGSLPFSIEEATGFDLTEVFTRCRDPMSGDIEQWKQLARVATSQKTSYFSLTQQSGTSSRPVTDDNGSDTNSDRELDVLSDVDSPLTPATPYSPAATVVEDNQSTVNQVQNKIEALSLTQNSKGRIRRFHPLNDTVRITVPTAHIYGKNDPYLSQSLQLVSMCRKELVDVVDHGGAHDIPRSGMASRAIASAIEKTVMKSEFML